MKIGVIVIVVAIVIVVIVIALTIVIAIVLRTCPPLLCYGCWHHCIGHESLKCQPADMTTIPCRRCRWRGGVACARRPFSILTVRGYPEVGHCCKRLRHCREPLEHFRVGTARRRWLGGSRQRVFLVGEGGESLDLSSCE